MKPSSKTRKAQLEIIFPILKEADTSLLMGDFNFCSSWTDENKNIPPEYLDLWAEIHPKEPGFTEDTDVNLMTFMDKRRKKQVRFDRVLLRSNSWKGISIELLGTKPIGEELFPSDHFGLKAVIQHHGQ